MFVYEFRGGQNSRGQWYDKIFATLDGFQGIHLMLVSTNISELMNPFGFK